VAIVTGGNGGIGKAIASDLAAMGANVVIAARNEIKTDKAVRDIKEKFGAQVLGVTVDVRKIEQIKVMIEKTLKVFKNIGILVNNAGLSMGKLPQDYTLDDWDNVINTNLWSVLLCSQAAYPIMKANGYGKIINIGSMFSIFGGAVVAAYGASKGGVVQLTKSLAVAWAKDNIQVNCILPGYINTDDARRVKAEIPTHNERVVKRTPVGRWGEPGDLAGTAILFG
jgi:2-deoxy-D-gluconate 3-dehydrogenase